MLSFDAFLPTSVKPGLANYHLKLPLRVIMQNPLPKVMTWFFNENSALDPNLGPPTKPVVFPINMCNNKSNSVGGMFGGVPKLEAWPLNTSYPLAEPKVLWDPELVGG